MADEADRLDKLLAVALAALKDGDEDGSLMALEEALKTADRLPKRDDAPSVICLPDRSTKNN